MIGPHFSLQTMQRYCLLLPLERWTVSLSPMLSALLIVRYKGNTEPSVEIMIPLGVRIPVISRNRDRVVLNALTDVRKHRLASQRENRLAT
jgi:hypothetical protein